MSNLLEKASILLTPTAYDDGKILSVKPIDGTGDFDFTRNSSATRVNSQGLIEDMQILSGDLVSNGDFSQIGPELVTNGDFATDSNWTKGTGWTISGGLLNASSVSSNCFQSSSFILGKTYKVTYSISNYVSGLFRVTIGSNGFGQNRSSNGTFTENIVYSGANFFYLRGSSSFTGSIDNVSVKQVDPNDNWSLGTGWSIGTNKATSDASVSSYLNQALYTVGSLYKLKFEVLEGTIELRSAQYSKGVGYYTVGTHEIDVIPTTDTTHFYVYTGFGQSSITNISVIEITDDTNLPRIDYSPYSGAGSCGHWLFEPQSTNLYLNSEPTANEGTSGGVTYESFNWAIGFTSCVKYGDNSALRYRYGGTVSASTEYTLSAFVIMDDLSEPIIGGQTSGNDFTFVIGGAVYSNANSSVNMGNNIWRVSVTAITSASPNAGNSGIIKYTAQSSKGFRVVGYQLEQQSFATSYIPTNGSTVTRLQDAAFGAGSTDLINSTEGVLYAEIAALSNQLTHRRISISDGTLGNLVYISFDTASNRILANANGKIMIYTVSDETEFQKIAVYYNTTAPKLFVNGVLRETETAMNAITGLNELAFDNAIGGNNFFGKTKCVAVFKEALTDAELTCLTTI